MNEKDFKREKALNWVETPSGLPVRCSRIGKTLEFMKQEYNSILELHLPYFVFVENAERCVELECKLKELEKDMNYLESFI